LLINVGFGVLFGLVPLVVGFIKHQRKYAFWGFILSIVGGAILGLILAIPVAAVFTWLIFSRSGKTDTVQTGDSANS
jgi:hypothetical protein